VAVIVVPALRVALRVWELQEVRVDPVVSVRTVEEAEGAEVEEGFQALEEV
jgi:hypothetical protein